MKGSFALGAAAALLIVLGLMRLQVFSPDKYVQKGLGQRTVSSPLKSGGIAFGLGLERTDVR